MGIKTIQLTIIPLFLLFAFTAKSQNIYDCSSNGGIYRINLETCTYTKVCSCQAVMTDIAFNNGILFGINNTGMIFRVDTLTGNIDSLTQLPAWAVSMESDNKGLLYFVCTDFSVFQVNAFTGKCHKLGKTGYLASGDIALNEDTLYMTSTGYELIRIVLNPFSCSKIGDINLYGLKLYGLTFKNVKGSQKLFVSATYHYGNGRPYNDIYEVDKKTAGVQLICADVTNVQGVNLHEINGLGSIAEDINPEYNPCSFSVYPVPASDYIHIQNTCAWSCSYDVTIVDLLGQCIFSGNILLNDLYSIEISTLANGLYLLKLQNKQGSQVVKVLKN